MRKFLIAALGLTILAGSFVTEATASTKFHKTPKQLKDYCNELHGSYTKEAGPNGGAMCMIGDGDDLSVVSCSGNGDCTISHTMVFSSKPSTHGPVGQASDTTLGNGGKKPAAGNTTGAGSTTVAGGNSGNGTPTGIKPPANSASTTVGANGGGPNGRPALQRQ